MPEGIRCRTNLRSPMRIVWPALWPPLKRATTCTLSVRRSTIFPLPSSPHWAPAITMLGMNGVGCGGRLVGRRNGLAERGLGHEGVAALRHLAQVLHAERVEPALGEALVVD